MDSLTYVCDEHCLDNPEPLFVCSGYVDNSFETAYQTGIECRQRTQYRHRKEDLWAYFEMAELAAESAKNEMELRKRLQKIARGGENAPKRIVVFHKPDRLHRHLMKHSPEPVLVTPAQLHTPAPKNYIEEEEEDLAGENPAPPASLHNHVEAPPSDIISNPGANHILPLIQTNDILPSIETDESRPVVFKREQSPTSEDAGSIRPTEARSLSPQSTITDEDNKEALAALPAEVSGAVVGKASCKAKPASQYPRIPSEESDTYYGPSSQEPSPKIAAKSHSNNPQAVQGVKQNRGSFQRLQPSRPERLPPIGYFGPQRRRQLTPIKEEPELELQSTFGYHDLQQLPVTGFAPLQEEIIHTATPPTGLVNALLTQPFSPQPVNTHLVPHLLDRPSAAALAKMENTVPTSKGNGTTRGNQETWSEAESQLLHRAATQWWHWKDNKTLSRGSSSGAALYRYFEFVFAEAGLSRSYYQLKNHWSRNERAKFGRSEQRNKKDGTTRDLVTSARPSAKAKVEAEAAREQVNKRKRMHTVIVDEDDDDDYGQGGYGSQNKAVRRF